MRPSTVFRVAILPMVAMLGSCSVIDVPISTAAGSGIARGSSITFATDTYASGDLKDRARRQIETELVRAGYLINTQADYVLEFAIAKRPSSVGILLPEESVGGPEAGTWRSRPIDKGTFALCSTSIYRIMLVISRQDSRTVVFKGSSDDDICGEISDDKLRNIVASSIAELRQRPI